MSLASVGKATALGCTVVSTITLEKSAGLAAPVRVATDRLSWISATSFSSPIRWRQRVSDERSKVSLCWKNSSPCMDGPGFARTLTFRPTGRLRSCIRPLAQPDPTAGLDGIRKPDALSQNRTQGARRGTGLIEPGCRPSAITSLSFASRSSLNSFPDCPGLCRQFACVICGEKEVPRDMIAQAIRASLFAIATATILGCRRPIRAVSQADGIPCPRRVQRKTA